jgi:DNA topoisomerase-1
MAKNLVIVESPAKAKTIEKYLGKDYSVMSSFGHIRDLPKKGLNIDIEHDFAPMYEISPDKKKIVNELKKASKTSTVWLASDEDREGEAIAWHLCIALGLKPEDTKRIVFHEITQSAIENAIKHPRVLDMKMVDAQQARRILDRLVGYELSPVLWKKVRTGLSAGRVQSVAVRLCVEREREIRAFETQSSYKITAVFDVNGAELPAELSNKLKDKPLAREFIEAAKDSVFTITDINKKPATRSPGAPFTTSTLQQEAARRLGYSVRQTMQIAQRLYEAGHITYMRTDSTIISTQAIKAAEDYIKANFGNQYHKMRQFKTKNQSAQEAHEAIRPTDFKRLDAGEGSQDSKIYQLIWQRTLAGQMTEASIERTEVTIGIDKRPESLLAKGEVLKFDGFMKVYGGVKENVILPAVEKGDKLKLLSMEANETFSKPPARYNEAGLVRKLEELGIGRPSTYAPTISVIQNRGYIEKTDLEGESRAVQVIQLQKGEIKEEEKSENYGADRAKLVPTSIAEVTTDFLVKYFPSIIDYHFTASIEQDFDEIASGEEEWAKVIKDFYKTFHPLVDKSESVSRQEVSQIRELGTDPKSGKTVFARFGRYGPMLQLGDSEDDKEKIQFAPLPDGSRLETIELAEALPMFELPRVVGMTTDGKEIVANIGRFGPYIKVADKFVSIKPLDPHTITLEEAIELYGAKEKADIDKYIAIFKSGIKVVKGQYGPYITDGKKNAKIPKDTDPTSLTEKDCQELLAKAPARKKFRRRKQ